MYTTMSSIDSDSQRLCTKFMVSSDEMMNSDPRRTNERVSLVSQIGRIGSAALQM